MGIGVNADLLPPTRFGARDCGGFGRSGASGVLAECAGESEPFVTVRKRDDMADAVLIALTAVKYSLDADAMPVPESVLQQIIATARKHVLKWANEKIAAAASK